MDCNATILIADDHGDVVELLRTYVRPLGCEVISARDGEEALSMAQEFLPDIVLLDVQMPKKSGWEVCQALKGVRRTAQISVILVTGRGDVKDRLAGLQVGADDYLVKPFDRKEVTTRISALLERRAESGPVSSANAESDPHEVLYDPATGLATIPLTIPRLKEILIEQGEVGVIHVDVEQFDVIESEYGWAFFDEFLRKVADALRAEVARVLPHSLLAASRAGGSSFYIFLETRGRTPDQLPLEKIAETLGQTLSAALRPRVPQMESAQIGFFTGSTRIIYQPQIRLERQIYQGMQTAIDAVRNAEQEQKKKLSRELREIIRRRRVTTLFQPIVRSADASIFGYEILTRGPSDSSFLNSDMLFSFARDNHLSWDLEALALESSLERLREIDLGDRKFLLNLEAEMFETSEFKFHEMVAFFAGHRGRFVFELTERAAIEDYTVFRKLLEEFRQKGIEIAIDDAGSGYASLEAIASLAPDYLKITKGLVSTLATEPIKQDLVKMLVELAARINAKTIAEGIETAEEYEWCRKLGIDLIQGYFVARPQTSLDATITSP